MKDYLEKAKDVLYDFSDYLIMGGIILSIVLIIGWRLDILFPENLGMANSEDVSEIDREIAEVPKDDTKKVADKENKTPETDKEEEAEEIPKVIKISIPNGTHSTGIGSILVDQGLIESTKDFENKVVELDLEKKLRSGEFDIAKNESLETIVKIIANQK
ncbi:MAG: hypothetical protein ACTHW2_01745 [Tissierella sp.]|uniref:hypothetical protein n=1 Tax=Tissierella sp. TaxID=41274 RepID=UPI003F9EAA4D